MCEDKKPTEQDEPVVDTLGSATKPVKDKK